jgi:medium-chain acyl-[acyl-carrier-protein] hydrolase
MNEHTSSAGFTFPASNVASGLSLPRHVPADAYAESLVVRSYEAGRQGAVSPGTLLRFLEHLATRASAWRGFDHTWYESHNSAWVVREMALELAVLPRMDDELRMATWLSGFRRVQAMREYAVWYPGSGRLAARAQGRWAYIDRRRGTIQRVHEELLQRFDVGEEAMSSRTIPLPAEDVVSHDLLLTAREYEADSQQHVNNSVYLDWLQEALLLATTHTDLAAKRTMYPRRYHLEYLHQVFPGDAVRISTRLEFFGSRGLRAWQRIASTPSGEIACTARSEHLLLPRPATLHGSQL